MTCAHTIIAEFGLRVYLKALYLNLAHPDRATFLDCIDRVDSPELTKHIRGSVAEHQRR